MSYAVYTIRDAATGEALYVGMTGDLRRRLDAHSRKPWAIGSVASVIALALEVPILSLLPEVERGSAA